MKRLAEELDVEYERLQALLTQIERTQLVRVTLGEETQFVELAHDYLVDLLEDLAVRVRAIAPRRLLASGLEQFGNAGELLSETALAGVLERLALIEPSLPEWQLLLRSAVAGGVRPDAVAPLLRGVIEHGGDPWDDLATMGLPPAALMQHLASLSQKWPEAEARLVDALATTELAIAAVEALSQEQGAVSVRVLEQALLRDELEAPAVAGLVELARQRRDRQVAAAAADVLLRFLEPKLDGQAEAPWAVDLLGRVEAPTSVVILTRLLGQDALAWDACRALLVLVRSFDPEVSAAAENAVAAWLSARLETADASRAVELLGEFEHLDAVDLLERTLQRRDLAATAEAALRGLSRATTPDVRERAQLALEEYARSRLTPPPRPRDEPRARPRRAKYELPSQVDDSYLAEHTHFVAKALLDGRLIFFLGAGVNAAVREWGREVWKPQSTLPSGAEVAEYLAKRFRYPDENVSLPAVAQYVALIDGYGYLYRELHEVFARDYPPAPVHWLVATLSQAARERGGAPARVLVLTTTYDDGLERAFMECGEPYDVLSYTADRRFGPAFLHYDAFGSPPRHITQPNAYMDLDLDARAVIVKLVGGVSPSREHEFYVISEDDVIDYVRAGAPISMLPATIIAALRSSHFLFMGHTLQDWMSRAALHTVLGADASLQFNSWAVQTASDFEREYWKRRSVEVVQAPLDVYLAALENELRGPALSP